MKCPACGRDAEGAFCPDCGAPKAGAACRSCRASLAPGARFCTECGLALREAAPWRLPWVAAGAVLALALIALLVPVLRSHAPGAAPMPLGGATTEFGAGGPPPLSGSIREQADRLFNRIMQARSEGDTEQAMFFVPMALMAYREAGPLDRDGLYHLGLLENLAGEHDAARATAARILADEPTHLLALAVAAEAALATGDSAAARNFYRALLDAFDGEHTRDLPEYRDHARILPDYRAAAEAFIR
jgi:tetratricopeptide (TPR) repeat protein